MRRRVRSLAHAIGELPGGRRTKFAVVGLWPAIAIAIAIGPLSRQTPGKAVG